MAPHHYLLPRDDLHQRSSMSAFDEWWISGFSCLLHCREDEPSIDDLGMLLCLTDIGSVVIRPPDTPVDIRP